MSQQYITPVRILDDDDLDSSSSSSADGGNRPAFAGTPLAPSLAQGASASSSSSEGELVNTCRGCADATGAASHSSFGGCKSPCLHCRMALPFTDATHTNFNGCLSKCPSCRAGQGDHRGKNGCNESCPACKDGTEPDHTGRDGCEELCPLCFTGVTDAPHTGTDGCQEPCNGCKAGSDDPIDHYYEGGGCANNCPACREGKPSNHLNHRFESYGCQSACRGCAHTMPIDANEHKYGTGACLSECYGCKYSRSGQDEHMADGGCMALDDDDDEEVEDVEDVDETLHVYGKIPSNVSSHEITVTFDRGGVVCTYAEPSAAVLTALTLFDGHFSMQGALDLAADIESATFSFGYNCAQVPSGKCKLRLTEGVINTLTQYLRSPTTNIIYGELPERFMPECSEQEIEVDINLDPSCTYCDAPVREWGDECDRCCKKRKRDEVEKATKKKRIAAERKSVQVEIQVFVDGTHIIEDVHWLTLQENTTPFSRITRSLYRISAGSTDHPLDAFDLSESDIMYTLNDDLIIPEDSDTLGDYRKADIIYASVYLETKE